jgi:hypothetical protein
MNLFTQKRERKPNASLYQQKQSVACHEKHRAAHTPKEFLSDIASVMQNL